MYQFVVAAVVVVVVVVVVVLKVHVYHFAKYPFLRGHPSTVFCKISVRISKYRLKVSTAPERLKISR